MKIEIEKTEKDGGWLVRVGDLYEDGLTRGEALEVLACLLFGPENGAPYLRNAEQHAAWDAKYRKTDEQRAAERKLLEDQRSARAEEIFPRVELKPQVAVDPEPEWGPPKLSWRWAGAGRWEGKSLVGDEGIYRIAMDSEAFLISADEFLCVKSGEVFPSLESAQKWCEQHDWALIPF